MVRTLFTIYGLLLSILLQSVYADGEQKDPMAEAHYRSLIQDANVALQKKNYKKTQQLIDKAEALLGKNPTTLNLRGAISTREKKWDEADSTFNQALEMDPNFFPALFNKGEILFLKGNYAEAKSYFLDLLQRLPNNELLQFKVFLSELLMGNQEEARDRLKKIRHPGETPAWYYAQSALSFKTGHRGEGKKYIQSAQIIFGEEKTALFDETFQDIQMR